MENARRFAALNSRRRRGPSFSTFLRCCSFFLAVRRALFLARAPNLAIHRSFLRVLALLKIGSGQAIVRKRPDSLRGIGPEAGLLLVEIAPAIEQTYFSWGIESALFAGMQIISLPGASRLRWSLFAVDDAAKDGQSQHGGPPCFRPSVLTSDRKNAADCSFS